MKIFIINIFLIVVFLLLGCEQKKERIEREEIDEFAREYWQKVENELNSKIITNDIFLTFNLGDSENDFNKKYNKLKKDGLIKPFKFYDGVYEVYEFVIGDNELYNGYAIIEPKYYNGNLYELTLNIRNHPKNTDFLSQPAGLMYRLYTKYVEKYGKAYRAVYHSHQDGQKYIRNYFWLNGNRAIEFRGTSIVYFDYVITKKKEEEIKQGLDKESIQTIDDI